MTIRTKPCYEEYYFSEFRCVAAQPNMHRRRRGEKSVTLAEFTQIDLLTVVFGGRRPRMVTVCYVRLYWIKGHPPKGYHISAIATRRPGCWHIYRLLVSASVGVCVCMCVLRPRMQSHLGDLPLLFFYLYKMGCCQLLPSGWCFAYDNARNRMDHPSVFGDHMGESVEYARIVNNTASWAMHDNAPWE